MYSTVTKEQLTSPEGAAARLEAKWKLSVLYLFQGEKAPMPLAFAKRTSAPPNLHDLLDEMKKCGEGISKVSEGLKKVSRTTESLNESYKSLRKDMNQQADDSFN